LVAGTLSTVPGSDDLEARVTALESQVRDLSVAVRRSAQDAAAARVLAGGADRDVSQIRSEIRDFREQNTRVLNAMREDLNTLRQDTDRGLREVREEMREIRQEMDRGFLGMRGLLDATAASHRQLAGMLTRIIDRENER
jgi:chromosome segregation ATPase